MIIRVLMATFACMYTLSASAAPDLSSAEPPLSEGKLSDPRPQDGIREGPWEQYSPDAWWIVYVKPGTRETYAIRYRDFGTGNVFFGSGGQGVRIWVRGIHKSNATVPYRQTMTLYRFLCQSDVFAKDQLIASGSKGNVVRSWKRHGKFEAWAPDSLEEAVADHVCRSINDR